MRLARIGWMLLLLGACASYKKNIMFIPPEDFAPANLREEAQKADRSFRISANDVLNLEVFTNSGERIIDPEFELTRNRSEMANDARPEVTYTVDDNGEVKLPLLGLQRVSGMTLFEAESMLQEKYAAFYKAPYVVLRFDNKRVIVLGVSEGVVVPLPYPGVTLAEVLALSKSVTNDSHAENIRVLRGEKVFVVDFTKPNGFSDYNLLMEPGDIVYVEPIRRPFAEGTQDISPVLSLVISLASLLVVIFSLN